MGKNVETIPETDLTRDIRHLIEKRDDAVNHLKDTIELNFSEEIARQELEKILEMNKELKLLEDQLVLNRIGKKK